MKLLISACLALLLVSCGDRIDVKTIEDVPVNMSIGPIRGVVFTKLSDDIIEALVIDRDEHGNPRIQQELETLIKEMYIVYPDSIACIDEYNLVKGNPEIYECTAEDMLDDGRLVIRKESLQQLAEWFRGLKQ